MFSQSPGHLSATVYKTCPASLLRSSTTCVLPCTTACRPAVAIRLVLGQNIKHVAVQPTEPIPISINKSFPNHCMNVPADIIASQVCNCVIVNPPSASNTAVCALCCGDCSIAIRKGSAPASMQCAHKLLDIFLI